MSPAPGESDRRAVESVAGVRVAQEVRRYVDLDAVAPCGLPDDSPHLRHGQGSALLAGAEDRRIEPSPFTRNDSRSAHTEVGSKTALGLALK